MRRRILILLGLGAVALGLLLAGVFLTAGRTVQIGMDESEVEQILGSKGMLLHFDTDEELKGVAQSLKMQAIPGAVMKRWDERHRSIHVLFDRNGRVAGVYSPRGAGHIVNRLLRSVGLD